jgi:amino acid transporter
VAVCGALLSQYTLTGFDASAHLSEETKKASWSAPIGVVSSVGFSALFGFFVLMALLFSVQDFDGVLGSAYGQPVLQILVDVAGEDGALGLFTLIMGEFPPAGRQFLVVEGVVSKYADTNLSLRLALRAVQHDEQQPDDVCVCKRRRDCESPFTPEGHSPTDSPKHPFFHKVDARFRSPTRAVWLSATLSFILALPSLGSSVAFAAATSIATIGLYLSYGLPILIGLICHRSFTAMKGPFNLHALSRPIATGACLWIGFITVVFCLPTANPVTSQTFNYTAVAVGILSIFAVGSWVVWAHRWFTGPSAEVAEALRLGVDILEPGALEDPEKQEGEQKRSLAVADRVRE